jgi:hypothetical protein
MCGRICKVLIRIVVLSLQLDGIPGRSDSWAEGGVRLVHFVMGRWRRVSKLLDLVREILDYESVMRSGT